MSLSKQNIERRFKPETCGSWIIAGCQNSGKTFFTRQLVKKIHKHYNQVVLISGTPYNNDMFDGMGIPSLTCLSFEEIGEDGLPVNRGSEYLQKLFTYQNQCKMQGVDYRTLLILEDFTAYIMPKDKTYKQIASFSRHIGLSVIYICQGVSNNIPTAIRNNCANWVIFNGLSRNELEGISAYFPARCKYNTLGFSSFYYDYNTLSAKRYSFFVMLRNEMDNNLIFCQPLKKHGRINIREERPISVSNLIRQAIDGK